MFSNLHTAFLLFTTILSFVAISAHAAAVPRDDTNGNCNVSGQYCCNSTMTHQDYPTQNTPNSFLPLGLSDLVGLVGLECSPLGLLGLAASSQCSGTPVCCGAQDQFKGAGALPGLNFGCSPLSIA